MSMTEIELGKLLNDLDRFSWKECVYIQRDTVVSPTLPCLVIDDNTADLGADGFTPLEVERVTWSSFCRCTICKVSSSSLITQK